MNRQAQHAPQISEYYLILEQVRQDQQLANFTDADSEELDHIEQIRRIVAEINDDPPAFITST